MLVVPASEYQCKIIRYSIRHKLLLKCAENYYIWSRRLKDTSKNMHGLAFLDHPLYRKWRVEETVKANVS